MMEARSPVIVLGVTGGIGAYKACEVARELMRRGCRVKVVMTAAAQRFVTPLTFRTLTDEPVATSMWDEPQGRVRHISLADEADVLAIVPATANVINKLAAGRADDLLTTTALATEAPLVIAPAMNTHMWRKAVTQRAVGVLRERGAVFVEPATGELACGDVGEGRLARNEKIVEAIMAEAGRCRDLEGVRLLVTAGPTREPIDAVRFIGNRSSGRQGYAIAEEAARRGATVMVVSGPTALPDPFGARTVRVETAEEMCSAVEDAYEMSDAVVMTAAVSDFRPASPAVGKVKKDGAPLQIALERTPDILAGLGANKRGRMLVGFAAETDDVVGYARGKLASKNLDMIVANDVSEPGSGFDSASNRVTFVTRSGEEAMPLMDKRAVARELLDRLVTLLKER